MEYDFVPVKLRKYFNQAEEKECRDKIVQFRNYRSLHVLHNYGNLYSSVQENYISEMMAQRLAMEKLEKKFAKVKAEHDLENEFTSCSEEDSFSDDSEDKYDQENMNYDDCRVQPLIPVMKKKLTTVLQLERQVIIEVEKCLNDCDIYLGVLQPKVQEIKFTAVSSRSTMLLKTIRRKEKLYGDEGKMPSFECADSGKTIVIEDIASSKYPIQFFSKSNGATLGSYACFPLLADASRKENDDTLSPEELEQRALYNKEHLRIVGVLGIDDCRKQAKLLPQSMSMAQVQELLRKFQLQMHIPAFRKAMINGRKFMQLNDTKLRMDVGVDRQQERNKIVALVTSLKEGKHLHLPNNERPKSFIYNPVTMQFLQKIANATGTIIDQHRYYQWKQMIQLCTKDSTCTMQQLYHLAVQGILDCLVMVQSCSIWRVDEKKNIYALATCSLPNDIEAPFTKWSERMMKKLLLHKEDLDSSVGTILQGTIQRVSLPKDAKLPWLNHADFHIFWSNGSKEIMKWTTLHRQLSFRPLNPNHHLLSSVLERLEPGKNFMMEDNPRCYVSTFQDLARPIRYTFAIQTTFRPEFDPSDAEYFIDDITNCLEPNIACIRAREKRATLRKHSMVKVDQLCKYLTLSSSEKALDTLNSTINIIFAEINTNLPGCQIAISELLPMGRRLEYTFAYNGCTLLGKFAQDKSVSFLALKNNDTILINPLNPDITNEHYDKLQYFSQKAIPRNEWPYIFVPMYHLDAKVGVLTVNRFVDVPLGRRDEQQPEDGVIQYLQYMAKMIANVVRIKRRSYALYLLNRNVAMNPFANPMHLFYTAAATAHDTIACCRKIKFIQLDVVERTGKTIYEFYTLQRENVLISSEFKIHEALKYRRNEVLATTIHNTLDIPMDNATKILSMLVSKNDINLGEDFGHCFLAGNGENVELDGNAKYILKAKSILKAISYSGKDDFLVAIIPSLSMLDRKNSIAVLYMQHFPNLLFSTDQKYLDLLANTISSLGYCIRQRLHRVRFRMSLLLNFKQECHDMLNRIRSNIETYYTAQEEASTEMLVELQNSMLKIIVHCIPGCNAYIGMHEPVHELIRYTRATKSSAMMGKRLKANKGVSFQVLNDQICKVVRDAAQIHCFGSTHDMRFPIVIAPLDTVGVLGVDNFKQYPRERRDDVIPEMGLSDFLWSMGSVFGKSVHEAREILLIERNCRRQKSTKAIKRMYNRAIDVLVSDPIQLTFVAEKFLQDEITSELQRQLPGTVCKFSRKLPLRMALEGIHHNSDEEKHCIQCYTLQGIVTIDHNDDASTLIGIEMYLPLKGYGVLIIQNFTGGATGNYGAACPEPEALQYLQFIVASYDKIVKQKVRRQFGLAKNIIKGNCTTFDLFVENLFAIMANVLTGMQSIEFCHSDGFCLFRLDATKKFAKLHEPKDLQNAKHMIHLTDATVEEGKSHLIVVQESPQSHPSILAEDLQHLQILLPIINSALDQVRENEKFARHRNVAISHLGVQCAKLASEASPEFAYKKQHEILSTICECIAPAIGSLSQIGIAELQPGIKSIKYVATSKRSALMGFQMPEDMYMSSMTQNCVEHNEIIVNNHLQNHTINWLTKNRAKRGSAILCPLLCNSNSPFQSEKHSIGVLNVDHFDESSYSIDGNLEFDVVQFLRQCANAVADSVLALRYRYAYSQFTRLKRNVAISIPNFYVAVLQLFRSCFLWIQSQQISELDNSFIGKYNLLCWQSHRSRTSLHHIPHYCYRHYCTIQNREHGIHFEALSLPMSNLPGALDRARSRNNTVQYEINKRSKVPCMATMLDTTLWEVASKSRISFCIYGLKDYEFSASQVSHAAKLAEQATLAYRKVFDRNVTRNFASQGMQLLTERLNAEKSALCSILVKSDLKPSQSPGITYSTNGNALPYGVIKNSVLWNQLHEFIKSNASVQILDTTPSSDKKLQQKYLDQVNVCESHDVEKKSNGLFVRLRQMKEKKELSNAEPPRIHKLLFVRYLDSRMSKRLAEIGVFYFRLPAITEDKLDCIFQRQAMDMRTQVLQAREEYLLSLPRDVDTATSILIETYRGAYALVLDVMEDIKAEIVSWISKGKTETLDERNLIYTLFLFLGYRAKFLECAPRIVLETVARDNIFNKFLKLSPDTSSSSWSAILRGRNRLSQIQPSYFCDMHDSSPALKALFKFEKAAIAMVRQLKHFRDKSKKSIKEYNKQAKKLQKFFASIASRRIHQRKRRELRACLKIQATCRQYLAYKKLISLRENNAATKIQRVFRRTHARPCTSGSSRPGTVPQAPVFKPNIRPGSFAASIKARQGLSVEWYQRGGDYETFDLFCESPFGKEEIKTEGKLIAKSSKEAQISRKTMETIDERCEILCDVFEYYDTTSQGSISRQCTIEIIQLLQIPLQKSELSDIIDMIDNDKSGTISLDELLAWYRYEFSKLHKRSTKTGTMTKSSKSWLLEAQAKRVVENKWHLWNKAKRTMMA